LRRPALGGKEPSLTVAAGLEHRLNQAQHAAVSYALGHQREKFLVLNRAERTSDTLPTVTSMAIPSGYELSGHAIRWRVKS
jgi:hypothetical protein